MLLCPTNPLNHVNGIGELNVDKKEEINVMFLKREKSGAHDNFPWRMGFTFSIQNSSLGEDVEPYLNIFIQFSK
jgi:hypothetical protein